MGAGQPEEPRLQQGWAVGGGRVGGVRVVVAALVWVGGRCVAATRPRTSVALKSARGLDGWEKATRLTTGRKSTRRSGVVELPGVLQPGDVCPFHGLAKEKKRCKSQQQRTRAGELGDDGRGWEAGGASVEPSATRQ